MIGWKVEIVLGKFFVSLLFKIGGVIVFEKWFNGLVFEDNIENCCIFVDDGWEKFMFCEVFILLSNDVVVVMFVVFLILEYCD